MNDGETVPCRDKETNHHSVCRGVIVRDKRACFVMEFWRSRVAGRLETTSQDIGPYVGTASRS